MKHRPPSRVPAILAVTAVALVGLSACSTSSAINPGSSGGGAPTSNVPPTTVENCGSDVTLDAPAERIVLVNNDSLPNLEALGAVDHVVALTSALQPDLYDDSTYSTLENLDVLSTEKNSTGGSIVSHRLATLSGGELQRVVLARALAQGTGHVALDEPTNHLDIRHRLEIIGLLRRIAPTVVIVLHDLELAAQVCDRVVVLHQGRVVGAGAPGNVLRPELLDAVYDVQTRVLTGSDGRAHFSFSLPPSPPQIVTATRPAFGTAGAPTPERHRFRDRHDHRPR